MEPLPPVTDAPEPIKVRFRINWEPPFNTPDDLIEIGWALSWTRASRNAFGQDLGPAGLVVWHTTNGKVATAWLPAGHIRRGWQPADDEGA